MRKSIPSWQFHARNTCAPAPCLSSALYHTLAYLPTYHDYDYYYYYYYSKSMYDVQHIYKTVADPGFPVGGAWTS